MAKGKGAAAKRAYDLLRGAPAAVAALALDPGDDGVRLRAALRARAQDVLHRLLRSIGKSETGSIDGTKEAPNPIDPMDHERTARNLSVCDGTTRSSWSAVSSMVGGYWRPRRGSSPASSHGRRTLWRGEYLRQQRLVIQQ